MHKRRVQKRRMQKAREQGSGWSAPCTGKLGAQAGDCSRRPVQDAAPGVILQLGCAPADPASENSTFFPLLPRLSCLPAWGHRSELIPGLRTLEGKRDGMSGASPLVQWLRLCASVAGSRGSIPGWGTKILHSAWCSEKY